MKPSGRVIARYQTDGAFPVQWSVDGRGRHAVRYGEQVHTFKKSDDVKAAEEFGLCVRHAAECAGLLDRN